MMLSIYKFNYYVMLNKKKSSIILVVLILILFIGLIFVNSSKKEKLTNIRIGWQTAWIPQAQLAEVLKNTDVLRQNKIVGDFKGFSSGAPMVEAAVAGQLDVLFVADFPAINLLSKTDKFTIISRLDDFRNTIIVPTDSKIMNISDLKGKTISVPFGTAPQVNTMKFIRDSGLDPVKDFSFKNLDILEQSNLIQSGTLDSWKGIDAFATWDPTGAIFESNGKARTIKVFTPVGVILMSTDFINQNAETASNFLKAFIEGYYYYAQNQKRVDQWLTNETKFNQPQNVIDLMTSLEKNLLAKKIGDIDIKLYDKHVNQLQQIANEAERDGLISKAPEMKEKINYELLNKAEKSIKESITKNQ